MHEHPSHEPAGRRAEAAGRRGSGWMMALGCLLAAAGFLRESAHSQGGPGQGGQTPPGANLPTVTFPSAAGGTADSNDRMIAVTGTDITGSSILYVIDTLNPHIAVYQASGGSASMNGIKLVAARRIDLDLRLDGFNDKSEHKFKDLERTFIDQGLSVRNQ